MTGEDLDGDGSVRLGIDFGAGTTVIAATAPGRSCTTVAVDGISRPAGGRPPVHAIPSLVRYEGGTAARFGDEVARDGATADPATARWIRRYVCGGSPARIPAGNGRTVRYEEAAADFLARVLGGALSQYPGAGIVCALPAGAPPEYPGLFSRAARTAGASTCSFIGEERAALAGNSVEPAGEDPVLIMAFTMAGMEVSVITAGENEPDGLRVPGRAAGSTGCSTIDIRVVQELLARFRLLECDPVAARLLPRLQYEVACLREQLPMAGEWTLQIPDPATGRTYSARYTAADLSRVLESAGVFDALSDCTGRALSAARARGADITRIREVILVGEGCAIPEVRDHVQARFPSCTVHADHPIDAIACGAALAAAPAPAKDRIACSYALRYWDPAAGEHHYRFLVHSGTRYPSAGQVARVTISASYDGQTRLGIPLCEIGDGDEGRPPGLELVSEAGGGIRIAGPEQETGNRGTGVHVNAHTPTLLVADPPARKGEPRFECTFSLDAGQNLCLTARDLLTGKIVTMNRPVYRLK